MAKKNTNVNMHGDIPHNITRLYLLEQNPFLINEDLTKEDIRLIDEFTVEYRKKHLPIYMLLENKQYRAGKKTRIFKRNFKKWRKEYLAKEKKFMEKLRHSETASDKSKTNHFPIYTWIIYCFAFICVILLFFHQQIFKKIPTFYHILLKVHNIINLPVGGYLLLALTLGLFFVLNYGIYQNIVLRFYKKKFNQSRKQLNFQVQMMRNEFRRKFKKVRKHYLIRVKSPGIKPLEVNQLMSANLRFDYLELLSEQSIANTSIFARNNRLFKVKMFLMHSLIIIIGLALIVFITIEIL